MSRSRRGSNKSRNGNNGSGNNGNGGNRNGNGNGGNANRGNGQGARDDGRDFWGTVVPTAADEPAVIETPDPTAMVRSLGMPPLAGNRPISEHYFTAVYGKAAGLAQALLAAERPVGDRDPD